MQYVLPLIRGYLPYRAFGRTIAVPHSPWHVRLHNHQRWLAVWTMDDGCGCLLVEKQLVTSQSRESSSAADIGILASVQTSQLALPRKSQSASMNGRWHDPSLRSPRLPHVSPLMSTSERTIHWDWTGPISRSTLRSDGDAYYCTKVSTRAARLL